MCCYDLVVASVEEQKHHPKGPKDTAVKTSKSSTVPWFMPLRRLQMSTYGQNKNDLHQLPYVPEFLRTVFSFWFVMSSFLMRLWGGSLHNVETVTLWWTHVLPMGPMLTLFTMARVYLYPPSGPELHLSLNIPDKNKPCVGVKNILTRCLSSCVCITDKCVPFLMK